MAHEFLIVSDLDGTLLGDDSALEELAGWLDERRATLRLAYSSGRSPESQRQSIAATKLPLPDMLIGYVGTHVECFSRGERCAGWPRLCGPWDPRIVRQVMATFNQLETQPEEFNSPHKVSYYYHGATPQHLAELESALAKVGQAVRVVYSSNRDLDILPAGLDKGAAAAFLAEYWQVPRERVIVCGDTANDLSMFQQGFLGVTVGNALPELRSLDSPLVYHAEGRFAAGVGEGLRHWFERVGRGQMRSDPAGSMCKS